MYPLSTSNASVLEETPVPAKPKRRAERAYHHGDLRNALLETALAHIAGQGARALSLREVARETGVSHASAYRHFPSKESVLATIAEQGFLGLTAAMREAVATERGDPLARLCAAGIAYVDFGVKHPNHLQVMFGDLVANHDEYPTLVAAATQAYEVLDSLVREGQQAGRVRQGNERTVALAAWAQVHGLTLLIATGQIRHEGPGQLDHKALASAVVGLQAEGLSTGPR
jgi:AcrR family transcriptional regulator